MAPSKLFQEIIDHVAKALKSTSMGYILSKFEDKDIREALFASVILQSLADYSSILGSLSKIYKKDLNDSIVTHSIKYIKTLEKYDSPSNDPTIVKNKDGKPKEGVLSYNDKESDVSAIFMPKMQDSQIFQQNLEIVKKALKAPNPKGEELTQEERDSLSVLLSKIIDKFKNIFAEQNNNQKEIDYLIALSCILVSSSLPLKDKDSLADDLVDIREIWSLDIKGEYTKDHKKLLFVQSFLQESDYTKLKSADDLLRLIIDQLITEKKLLEDCTDAELLNLYSRLKGNMRFINHFHQLLSELHKESKIRYSCNRVSNEGYDLLNKFQNFDTVNNNIELLENIVVESYLLKKDYLKEVINHLEANIASITYLKLSASGNFTIVN